MTCYRGGAGASGQSSARASDPLLRVDRDEDLWLLPARQGGAHHPGDRGQDKEMRQHASTTQQQQTLGLIDRCYIYPKYEKHKV